MLKPSAKCTLAYAKLVRHKIYGKSDYNRPRIAGWTAAKCHGGRGRNYVACCMLHIAMAKGDTLQHRVSMYVQ